jgi:hypothetical protein
MTERPDVPDELPKDAADATEGAAPDDADEHRGEDRGQERDVRSGQRYSGTES